MLADAYTRDGQPIRASLVMADEWERMKALSQTDPDSFAMSCCRGRAVLKTSLYGVQFFAHYSTECATAPETAWHVAGKDACLGALQALGISGRAEVPGSEIDGSRWEADVFFEHHGRKVVIELQRSYQHLRDFVRRQERYALSQVACYWLLREEVAHPLMKSIAQKRLKDEFGGKFPACQFFPVLPNLPWAIYRPEAGNLVFGPGMRATLEQWIAAVADERWAYDGNIWVIAEPTVTGP